MQISCVIRRVWGSCREADMTKRGAFASCRIFPHFYLLDDSLSAFVGKSVVYFLR